MAETDSWRQTGKGDFVGYSIYRSPILHLILDQTSKFEWMLNKIRTEKIILVPIWATKLFSGGFSTTRC